MWEFQRLNPSSLKRSLFMCPTLSYRLFQCLWDGSVSESAFVVNAVVCFQWRGDVPFNGDAVTVKRRARAGITVSHLYAEASSSFVTLRTLQAKLLNLLPGVCYPFGHDSAWSCPRRRILIWVLSYSVIGNLYHWAFERSALKVLRDEHVYFRNLFSQALVYCCSER